MCSAVQNQDFTLIDDYCTGLRALLYLQGLHSLSNWDGQSPPVEKHQKGKPLLAHNKVAVIAASRAKTPKQTFQHLSAFGKFQHERNVLEHKLLEKKDLLEEAGLFFSSRPTVEPTHTKKVGEVIGQALEKIGAYGDLDNSKQVVALIDDVTSLTT